MSKDNLRHPQKKVCECRVCQHYRIMMKTSRIRNLSDRLKRSHTITIVIRTDGKEHAIDGGFLKQLLEDNHVE